jgi:hypothetical protein
MDRSNLSTWRLFDIWSELTGSQRWIWTTFRTPKVLFWIDTLCIPVGQEYNHIKMQAINSMAKTYASAQAIVIRKSSILESLSQSSWDF